MLRKMTLTWTPVTRERLCWSLKWKGRCRNAILCVFFALSSFHWFPNPNTPSSDYNSHQEYFESQLGCALPWRFESNSQLETCSTQSQFGALMDLYGRMREEDEQQIYEETGCLQGSIRKVEVVMFCDRTMQPDLQACERTDYGIVNRYDYNDYNTHALLYNESTVIRIHII